MEKADLVIVGAEGVVENGGIINKVGTATLALDAPAAQISSLEAGLCDACQFADLHG